MLSVQEISVDSAIIRTFRFACACVILTHMGIIHSGKRNPNWKGGRSVASNGYVIVKMLGHPLADVRGYVYEHRLVAEKMLGRPLEKGEIVHHLNHDKTDNRAENLLVTSPAQHGNIHRKSGKRLRYPDEPNEELSCECGCGTTFLRFDKQGRPRRFVSGHNRSRTKRPQ